MWAVPDYQTQRADAGNGNPRRELYHYGARAYLPGVGVFTQPDNVVPDYGDPRSLNRYAYTRGNPLKYTDPTGHRVSWGEDDGGDGDSPDIDLGAETTASAEPGAAFIEANTDQGIAPVGLAILPTYQRPPDYWTVSVGVSGAGIGVVVAVTSDRTGQSYIGANVGLSLSLPVTFSLMSGYVRPGATPNKEDLRPAISGWGGSAGATLGVGRSWSSSATSLPDAFAGAVAPLTNTSRITADEIGAGLQQVGISIGFTVPVFFIDHLGRAHKSPIDAFGRKDW